MIGSELGDDGGSSDHTIPAGRATQAFLAGFTLNWWSWMQSRPRVTSAVDRGSEETDIRWGHNTEWSD